MIDIADTSSDRALRHEEWVVLAGIKETQIQLATVLDAVVTRLENLEKGRGFPWTPVAVIGGFISTAMALFLTLGAFTYNTQLDNFDARLASYAAMSISHESDNHPQFVTERLTAVKEQLDRRWTERAEADDQHALRNQEAFKEVHAAIKAIVPRSEHQQREELVDKRFDNHIREADEAHRQGKANLDRSDDQIFARIERLEAWLAAGRKGFNGE